MVPKRGEGGMLTGGVRGSSSVMRLLVGSKKATLGGVGGAITIVRVVKVADVGAGGSGGGGRRSRDGGVEKCWDFRNSVLYMDGVTG
jgi:hypothetical protein